MFSHHNLVFGCFEVFEILKYLTMGKNETSFFIRKSGNITQIDPKIGDFETCLLTITKPLIPLVLVLIPVLGESFPSFYNPIKFAIYSIFSRTNKNNRPTWGSNPRPLD